MKILFDRNLNEEKILIDNFRSFFINKLRLSNSNNLSISYYNLVSNCQLF